MAILLARLYSGNHDLIALRNCYHGISEGLLGVLGHSTWKYNVPSVRKHLFPPSLPVCWSSALWILVCVAMPKGAMFDRIRFQHHNTSCSTG